MSVPLQKHCANTACQNVFRFLHSIIGPLFVLGACVSAGRRHKTAQHLTVVGPKDDDHGRLYFCPICAVALFTIFCFYT